MHDLIHDGHWSILNVLGDDMEISVTSRALTGSKQQQSAPRQATTVTKRSEKPAIAMKSKPIIADDASFEISGDLSFSGDLDLDQHTPHPAPRPEAQNIVNSTLVRHQGSVRQQGSVRYQGSALTKGSNGTKALAVKTSLARISHDSDSIDMDQVSFGRSSTSAESFKPTGRGSGHLPKKMDPHRSLSRQSVDTDDIQFSDDEEDGESISSSGRRRMEPSRIQRPASASATRPASALGRISTSLSHTPSISGE